MANKVSDIENFTITIVERVENYEYYDIKIVNLLKLQFIMPKLNMDFLIITVLDYILGKLAHIS